MHTMGRAFGHIFRDLKAKVIFRETPPPPPHQISDQRWVIISNSSYDHYHPNRRENGQELATDSTNWTQGTHPCEEMRQCEKLAQGTNPIRGHKWKNKVTLLKYNRTNLVDWMRRNYFSLEKEGNVNSRVKMQALNLATFFI